MKSRRIGPFTVSAIGLGCMNLSHAYGRPVSPEQGAQVIAAALDAGVTHFDTAALYGFGRNEALIGPLLRPHRQSITLASKGGMAGVAGDDGVARRVIDGRPATVRRNCEDSLRRIETETIDLYYLHRWDKTVPIEESVGEMGRLVEEGKVRALGLSEVSAVTLRRAHAVHPIVAVQNEYSLWSRNVEIAVLDACRDIGAALVAFSPLGRGFLAGNLTDVSGLDEKDIRRPMPRFAPDAYAQNLKLIQAFQALAAEAGCTSAQLALAWLLAQGEHVVPIPGTTSVQHLIEDLAAADTELPASAIQAADRLINQQTVAGSRYPPLQSAEVDTEEFA
jgi:aryl-alcohol dehydrogenase-like predicted oxidoreductase